MELGVGTLFSTSAGSVSGAGVGDVLVDDSRDGALREECKPVTTFNRTMPTGGVKRPATHCEK